MLLGMGLNFSLDGFRIVYCCVAVIMWLCSTFISKEYFGKEKGMLRYYGFSALTFASTVGVFLSSDLFTTFCFFEIMSFASYVLVIHTQKPEAMRAGSTYLAVAVIGGLVMLMGLFMFYSMSGTLDMKELAVFGARVAENGDRKEIKKLFIAGFLVLFGFGAKAGMFPLHIWLPKAHPVAPAPASALLSGILTKCGIFGVLILCMGIFREFPSFGAVIYVLGLITMATGAILAVFSIDLKRTLACSSVSQIGFILTGAGLVPIMGEECTLALSGTLLYMVNHSMFKLCLFLAAGAVYLKCHRLDLNEIRGFGRDMKFLKVLFAIGALGISGVPLFSGYISKTLIHEGIVECAEMSAYGTLFDISEWVFLVCGGMTAAYMTKLFIAVFVEKPDAVRAAKCTAPDKKLSPLSIIAVLVPALFIVSAGLNPKLFIGGLSTLMCRFNGCAFSAEQTEILENIRIFSLENLKGSLISLSFGAVFYLLIRRFLMEKDQSGRKIYVNRWPARLDLEELVYRPLLLKILPGFFLGFFRIIAITVPEAVFSFLVRAGKVIAEVIALKVPKGIYRFILKLGKILASVMSAAVDRITEWLRLTLFAPLKTQEHRRLKKLAVKFERIEADSKIVASAISYGMLLICLGLMFTLIYLLFLV